MLIKIRAHEKHNKGYCISKVSFPVVYAVIFARFYVISVNTHTTHCTISVSHFFMFSLYRKAKGLTS